MKKMKKAEKLVCMECIFVVQQALAPTQGFKYMLAPELVHPCEYATYAQWSESNERIYSVNEKTFSTTRISVWADFFQFIPYGRTVTFSASKVAAGIALSVAQL